MRGRTLLLTFVALVVGLVAAAAAADIDKAKAVIYPTVFKEEVVEEEEVEEAVEAVESEEDADNEEAVLEEEEAAAAKEKKKFCPLETNDNQCRSRRSQFKCGAFFMNLHGQNDELSWISALPDMMLKPSVSNSRTLMASIGNPRKRDFAFRGEKCTADKANVRCLDMIGDLAHTPMDSCQINMLNEDGVTTLGNILCHKAGLHVPGQQFQAFIDIGFYYSACGGPWTPTHFDGQSIRMKEQLCCKFDGTGGKGAFFRCEGGQFNSSCTELPRA